MSKILKIKNIELVKDFTLKITFNDKMIRVLDFSDFLKKSQNPEIKKYLNSEKFNKYSLHNGDLMWGDYELIFPISDLYAGKIS